MTHYRSRGQKLEIKTINGVCEQRHIFTLLTWVMPDLCSMYRCYDSSDHLGL